MRQWLRQILGRTRLERIEHLAAAAAERARGAEARADEHRALLVRMQALLETLAGELRDLRGRQEPASLPELVDDARAAKAWRQEAAQALARLEEHAAADALRQDNTRVLLAEREALRERLQAETERARQLADQAGHLLSELGGERRALAAARTDADIVASARSQRDAAEHELIVARRERDALRADVDRLEAACAAFAREREALAGELQRTAAQRDEALRHPAREATVHEAAAREATGHEATGREATGREALGYEERP